MTKGLKIALSTLAIGAGAIAYSGTPSKSVVTNTPYVPINTYIPATSSPTPKPVVTKKPITNCHPSYSGVCLNPNASDYDCVGGSGNGPYYTGRVRVIGPDVFDLDRDNDGWGCEQ